MEKINLANQEKEIEELVLKVEHKLNSPYVPSNIYGFGKHLKEYGFFPDSLPLCIYMDHGITFADKIPPHEINNDAPCMFKFSPRLVKIYKSVSDKPCYPLPSPYVFYRRKNKITVNSNAEGTIIFPAHSTPDLDDLTDWKEYMNELNQLPGEYKPITICLHENDIKKGLHKLFLSSGFKVTTAGAIMDARFTERFYYILRQHKYSVSNLIGSYAFYSVEMGIPFTLYGKGPVYFNKNDPNIEKGNYTSYKTETYNYAKKLFTGFQYEVTNEQKKIVSYELGLTEGIGRLKTALLLYKSFFIYRLRNRSV
ncbi:MAG: hypothetical protein ABI855_17090 [Bacteroidota bacterium]